MSQQEHFKKLIEIYTRNLQLLQEKQALLGRNTPVDVLTEIEDVIEKLKRLQEELKKIGTGIQEPTTEDDAKSKMLRSVNWPVTTLLAVGVFAIVVILTVWSAYKIGVNEGQQIQQPDNSSTSNFLPPTSDVFLSEFVEIIDFNEDNSEGWRPVAWDDGWIDYVDSGNVEVVNSDFVLAGHSGPFLKYPLELKADDIYASTIRNAIYNPIGKKITGIVANVFYESDPQYSLEEIRAGFVIPFRLGNGELLRNEDSLKKLTPNKWNTIVWSLYGPVWWDSKDKDQAWNTLKDLFGDEAKNLQVGRDLHNEKIEKIGIQFIVNSEDGPKEFKGTAYIDNIVLIYEHP